MSLVDVDTWVTEYDACERLNRDLIQQLAQREKRQRLSAEYNKLTQSIHVGLKQFDVELKQLKSKLDAAAKSNSITFEEIEQRQCQVDTLQSQFQQLHTKFYNSAGGDRLALLEGSSSSSNTAAVIDISDVNALKQHQIDVMEQQNQGLEVLSQTLSRQRMLASRLGQEVEDQNDILDNLANTMDRVEAHVDVETGNISQVNRKDSTWCYWLVIIVLFIAIILVSVL